MSAAERRRSGGSGSRTRGDAREAETAGRRGSRQNGGEGLRGWAAHAESLPARRAHGHLKGPSAPGDREHLAERASLDLAVRRPISQRARFHGRGREGAVDEKAKSADAGAGKKQTVRRGTPDERCERACSGPTRGGGDGSRDLMRDSRACSLADLRARLDGRGTTEERARSRTTRWASGAARGGGGGGRRADERLLRIDGMSAVAIV